MHKVYFKDNTLTKKFKIADAGKNILPFEYLGHITKEFVLHNNLATMALVTLRSAKCYRPPNRYIYADLCFVDFDKTPEDLRLEECGDAVPGRACVIRGRGSYVLGRLSIDFNATLSTLRAYTDDNNILTKFSTEAAMNHLSAMIPLIRDAVQEFDSVVADAHKFGEQIDFIQE